MMKFDRRVWTLILVALVLLPQAAAIGIAPSRSEHVVSLDDTVPIRFKLFNDGSSAQFVLTAEGKLADYITIAKSTVVFREGETEQWVSAELTVPPDLEPGPHESKIVVMASPTGDGTFAVSLGVAHRVTVIIEYPDEYLEPGHYIYSQSPGTDSLIELWLQNLGTLPVNADVSMQVVESDVGVNGEPTAVSVIIPVRVEERSKHWWVPPYAGEFLFEASVEYAGEVLEYTTPVKVGEPVLIPVSAEFRQVPLGEIIPLTIRVLSNWNSEITGAHVDVRVRDGKDVIFTTQSQSEDIGVRGEQELPIYIDTAGMNYGIYSLELDLISDKSSNSYEFEFTLGEQGTTLTPTGFMATVDASGPKPRWQFYVFLLGLFMTLGVTILALTRRRRRH